VCGNVVLVHFPTIVVGHGPGTHLAGLYNRRWLPLAVTISRQALVEFVSRGVGSDSAKCRVLTRLVEFTTTFKHFVCSVVRILKTRLVLCLCVLSFQDAA
jgi:hypothetical protein